MIGGAVVGGLGQVSCSKNHSMTGGGIGGGSFVYAPSYTFPFIAIGGAVAGGSATYLHIQSYSVDGLGGAVAGGTGDVAFETGDATQTLSVTMAGGAVAGGSGV
jgi:hypothetical protein